MRQKVLKICKGFSIVLILISLLGAASLAQAGKKSYRGGVSLNFGSKGSYKGNYGYKYKSYNPYRNSYSYGKKSSYNSYYNSGHRSYYSGKSSYRSNYFPYRNYAFRSYKGYSNKSYGFKSSKRVIIPHSQKKHGANVVIAGSSTAAVQAGELTPSNSNADESLACYQYRLTSVGGIGGFKFGDSDNAIKVANNNTITGEFCGRKFVEFELAKVDPNVAIDFELNKNIFKFPANAEAALQDGWQKKFFSVDLKANNNPN